MSRTRAAIDLVLHGRFIELIRRARNRLFGYRAVDISPDTVAAYSSPSDREPIRIQQCDRPKILMFSHNLNLEGAPISQFELTQGLVNRNLATAEVVSFHDGIMRTRYEASGIRVSLIPSHLEHLSSLRRLDWHVNELANFISNKNPDIIFANTLLTFLVVLAAKKVGVPVILNCRESEPWQTYFGFLPYKVAQHALISVALATRVIFVSTASYKAWSRLNIYDNFSVIHNALRKKAQSFGDKVRDRSALRVAHGCVDDETVFLCVGTLCERKGQLDAIQSFSKIPPELISKAWLFLVGNIDPSYKRKLSKFISRLPDSCRARIRFVEQSEEIDKYYLISDIFVHCARVESFPRVILEALFFEIPIITTHVFGIAEQVVEGESAMLYSPGDSVVLTNLMKKLMTDDVLRERLKKGAALQGESLISFDEMISRYYEEILSAINYSKPAANVRAVAGF